jgi:uncharacterized RDD family membrane protein YckC
MLDTIKIAETPEGVALEITCAGFYARGIAWFFDALIQGAMIFFMAMVLPNLGNFGLGLFFIGLFLLHWLYPVFFEMYMQGQTPGKKMMGIQVLLVDGTMVNWGASLLRNLLRTVDFLPFFYGLGVTTMLLSKDFRRLGDLAANTIVVYKRVLKQKSTIASVQPCAPRLALTAREQQTIVNYAERLQDFSPERAEELAALATPLLDEPDKKHQTPLTSERLLGIANYILGRR